MEALGLPPALVMEAGRATLTDWLRDMKPDPMAQKMALHQILSALVHLHAHKLVHRDLKVRPLPTHVPSHAEGCGGAHALCIWCLMLACRAPPRAQASASRPSSRVCPGLPQAGRHPCCQLPAACFLLPPAATLLPTALRRHHSLCLHPLPAPLPFLPNPLAPPPPAHTHTPPAPSLPSPHAPPFPPPALQHHVV